MRRSSMAETSLRTVIQIPSDAQLVGCRQVGPFEFAQVFSSVSANFTGTEREFVAAGHGYTYSQVGKFERHVAA